jgi:hypothetical protein
MAKLRAWLYLALIAAVVIGLAVALFLLPYLADKKQQARLGGLKLSGIGTSPSAAGCLPRKTVKVVVPKDGWHVDPGTTLTYADAPPAYGKHWATFVQTDQYRTFFSAADRPPKELLVHSLEHGHTVFWYDETMAADPTELADLKELAAKFVVDDGIVFVPWTSKDGGAFPDGAHLAMTHWAGSADDGTGVWEYCTGVSGSAVKSFVVDYPKKDSPEPNAP